jgi:anti-sigma B factor antagonist
VQEKPVPALPTVASARRMGRDSRIIPRLRQAGPQTVEVTTRQLASVVLVKPTGRIDQSNAAAFEAALAPLWGRPDVAALLLDFSGVEYISSVGLRVLMIAARQMRGRKARIAVAGLQSVVGEIFAISRFNTVIEVFPALRDALGALSSDALAAYDAG